MKRLIPLIFAVCVGLAGPVAPLKAQDPDPVGINALTEVPLSQLSDPGNSVLGQAALAVRPGDWKDGAPS